MKLWQRWNELWEAIGGVQNTTTRNRTYARLRGFYCEPHRAYHTMAHIESCLGLLDRSELAHRENRLALEWAIWLHDVVYDPHRTDNEDLSAEQSSVFLGSAGVGRVFERSTSRLILATKFGHEPKTADEKILLDIDHSILGESPDVFDGYDRAIRQEFSFVPWYAYVAGRRKVLERFRDRQPFFHTDAFRSSDHEKRIQPNLTRALERLSTNQDTLLAS